jgi:hypothetical protein
MVEFNKNEYGVWEEHGSLPPGCHLVNLQYLVAGSWEPPIGSMAALRPARVRELMNDPSGPKPKESYRMIPITVIPKEIDMSKAKKTKAPKVTNAGRERGLAAIAKEKAAKPATSDTSKVKSAAEPKSNKTTQMVELLRREGGVTLDELVKLTGWKANSVRGFLSGTISKKMGLKLESTKGEDGKRVYQVAS